LGPRVRSVKLYPNIGDALEAVRIEKVLILNFSILPALDIEVLAALLTYTSGRSCS
jgi:hypothetical protein